MLIAVLAWMACVTACAFATIYVFRRGQLAAAAALFYLSLLVCVRPVFFFLGLDTPLPDNFFGDVFGLSATASLFSAYWVALFFVGHQLAFASNVRVPFIPDGPAAPDPTRTALFAYLLTGLGVLIVAYFIMDAGSVGRFMVAVKIDKEFRGLYFVRQFNIVGALAAIYGMMAASVPAAGRKRRRRIPQRAILIYLPVIIINFAALYVWGYRTQVMNLGFVLAISYHLFIRRFQAAEVIAYLVLAFAGLHALRFLREILRSDALGNQQALVLANVSFVRGLSSSMHFVQFDGLMLAIQDAGRRFAFRDGADFWNGLLSWIPRFILPERESYMIGGWFRRVYEPTRANGWPITVVGSWWVNFGLAGVFLGSFLSGLATGLFDRRYDAHSTNPWHPMAATAVGFFMLDGGLNTGAIQDIALLLVPLAVVAAVVAPAKRRRLALGPA